MPGPASEPSAPAGSSLQLTDVEAPAPRVPLLGSELDELVWTRRRNPTETEKAYLAEQRARIDWHVKRAEQRGHRYRLMKLGSLSCAAAIPVASVAVSLPRWGAAVLGAAIVLLEGVQQLLRDHEMSLAHNIAAAQLSRELRKFDLNLEPYSSSADPYRALARRLEDLTAEYEDRYASVQTDVGKSGHASSQGESGS